MHPGIRKQIKNQNYCFPVNGSRELIDLLMADSSEDESEGSARAETDPYMQSKCLNKVRKPETDPYM